MNDIIKSISAKQTITNYKDSEDAMTRRIIRSSWNNSYATGTVNGQKRAIGEFRAVTNTGDFLSRVDYACNIPNGISSGKVQWRSRIGNIMNKCDGSGIPCSNTNIKFVPDSSDYTRYKKQRMHNKNYNDTKN
jgi:hypothetical protein